MTRRPILVLLLASLFAGLIFESYSAYANDPLRSLIGPDGAIHLRGEIGSDLLRYLFNQPVSHRTLKFTVPVDRPGGTMSWRTEIIEFPPSPGSPNASPTEIAVVSRGIIDLYPAIGRMILDGLKSVVLFGFNLISGDASAACAGGACFWVGGTGGFSDVGGLHWALSSGGVPCVCTPAATDTITFDANSGSGTATQDNATFTSGAVDMSNSSVTVAGSSNTWKVGGNFNISKSIHIFTPGTSTVEFTSSGSVTTTGGVGKGDAILYNLTVDTGVTLTLAGSNMDVKNVVTLSGTGGLAQSGSRTLSIGFANTVSQTDPLVVGTGTMVIQSIQITNNTSPGNFNIAASANYPFFDILPSVNNAIVTFTGDITASRLELSGNAAATSGITFSANSRTLTVTNGSG